MKKVETVKEFLNELKNTDTKVLNYDKFLTELKNTHEQSTTGSLKTNILTPKEGLIPIDSFLVNLFTYEGQGHFLSNSEIKELENDTTNYKYYDKWYTRDDGGTFLAHDISMDMFLNDTGSYLVFLQVQVGLDERSGFSSYIAFKFNTEDDCDNALVYDNKYYDLASCSIKTQEGNTYIVRVTSRPLDYIADMYVTDNDTKEEIFSTSVDYADLDSIKFGVNHHVNNNLELYKKFHIKEFTDYKANVIGL